MVLYASRAASYNDVVQVLDLLQSVGGDRVALATLPGSSPAESSLPSSIPGSTLPGAGGSTLPSFSPGLGNSGSSPNSSAPSSTSPYGLDQLTPDLNQPSTGKPSGSSTPGSSTVRQAPSTP
jgi:biopolymer transport protein ExbD